MYSSSKGEENNDIVLNTLLTVEINSVVCYINKTSALWKLKITYWQFYNISKAKMASVERKCFAYTWWNTRSSSDLTFDLCFPRSLGLCPIQIHLAGCVPQLLIFHQSLEKINSLSERVAIASVAATEVKLYLAGPKWLRMAHCSQWLRFTKRPPFSRRQISVYLLSTLITSFFF